MDCKEDLQGESSTHLSFPLQEPGKICACRSLEEDSITIFKFRGGRMSFRIWLRFFKEAQG